MRAHLGCIFISAKRGLPRRAMDGPRPAFGRVVHAANADPRVPKRPRTRASTNQRLGPDTHMAEVGRPLEIHARFFGGEGNSMRCDGTDVPTRATEQGPGSTSLIALTIRLMLHQPSLGSLGRREAEGKDDDGADGGGDDDFGPLSMVRTRGR